MSPKTAHTCTDNCKWRNNTNRNKVFHWTYQTVEQNEHFIWFLLLLLLFVSSGAIQVKFLHEQMEKNLGRPKNILLVKLYMLLFLVCAL